jgi:hypothetical protein
MSAAEFELLESHYWQWLRKECPFARADVVQRDQWIRETPFPFGGQNWRRVQERLRPAPRVYGGWAVTYTAEDGTVIADSPGPRRRSQKRNSDQAKAIAA